MGKSKRKKNVSFKENRKDNCSKESVEESKKSSEQDTIACKILKDEYKWAKHYNSKSNKSKMNTKVASSSVKELRKSVKTSSKYRLEGNSFFETYRKGGKNPAMHIRTLINYTKSLLYAPCNTDELAYSYSNRSTLLISLRKYKESLDDIDRALNISTITALKLKLTIQRLACLQRLGMSTDLKIAYETAIQWLQTIQLDEKTKYTTLNMIDGIFSGDIDMTNLTTQKFQHPSTFQRQLHIPCSGDALIIKQRSNFATTIVAARDIHCGEILISENPFTVYVHEDDGKHFICSFCGKFTLSGIPCDTCPVELYCSQHCKVNAFLQFHNVECKMPINNCEELRRMKKKTTFLAMRIFIESIRRFGGIDLFKKVVEKILQDDENGRSEMYINLCNHNASDLKYTYYKHFMRNILNSTFSEEQIKQNSECANILVNLYLQGKMGYSKLDSEESSDHHVVFLTMILTRILLAVPLMSSTLERSFDCSCYNKCKDINKERFLYTVSSAHIFCSILKQSCCGNTSSVLSDGGIKTIYANCNILKGEEITVSHQYPYHGFSKSERSLVLASSFRKINFTCDCTACKENWPIQVNLSTLEDSEFPSHIAFGFHAQLDEYRKILSDSKKDGELLVDTFKKIGKDIESLWLLLREPSKEAVHLNLCLRDIFESRYGVPPVQTLSCKCGNVCDDQKK